MSGKLHWIDSYIEADHTELGKNFSIGKNVHINVRKNCRIGNNVHFGDNVKITVDNLTIGDHFFLLWCSFITSTRGPLLLLENEAAFSW